MVVGQVALLPKVEFHPLTADDFKQAADYY